MYQARHTYVQHYLRNNSVYFRVLESTQAGAKGFECILGVSESATYCMSVCAIMYVCDDVQINHQTCIKLPDAQKPDREPRSGDAPPPPVTRLGSGG